MNSIGEATFGLKMPGWVTDGHSCSELKRESWECCGRVGASTHAQGVAYSVSGSIKGPWVQEPEAFKGDNSDTASSEPSREALLIIHHWKAMGHASRSLNVDDSGDKS